MFDVESCYDGGDLVKALEQAAAFIKRLGDRNTTTVAVNYDEATGWTVLAVYTRPERADLAFSGSNWQPASAEQAEARRHR